MEFISKYDISFIKYINRKYNKKFKDFDEYALFLYELLKSEKEYYYKLEDEIKEYCNYQQERKYGNGKYECKTKEPREKSSPTRFN